LRFGMAMAMLMGEVQVAPRASMGWWAVWRGREYFRTLWRAICGQEREEGV
jgi:hypothetical protein